MASVITITNHDDYHMLALFEIGIPSRKQPSCREAFAAPNGVGVGKGCRQAIAMIGQQVWMALSNVPLPLFAQFDRNTEIWARKGRHGVKQTPV